jgi:hypothetical protein
MVSWMPVDRRATLRDDATDDLVDELVALVRRRLHLDVAVAAWHPTGLLLVARMRARLRRIASK